jgi:hypothetical protein
MWDICYKKKSLETLDVIFSNDIIFVLYNLDYIGKIGGLGAHIGLINRYGGST